MSKGASLCTEKWHEPAESRMEAPQWIHGCLSGYMDASVDTWKHLSGYIRKHLSGYIRKHLSGYIRKHLSGYIRKHLSGYISTSVDT